mgnify:CR=1 FL=1
MLAKLPKMNLKHLKVFFGGGEKKPAALEDGVAKPAAAAKEDGEKALALDEKKPAATHEDEKKAPAAVENGGGELARAAKEDEEKPAAAL